MREFRKKPYLAMTLSLAVLVTLFSVVLTPLYLVLNADVLFQSSALSVVLYTVLEYFSYFIFWLGFAFVGVLFLTKKKWLRCAVILSLAFALQYALAYLAQGVVYGFDEDALLYDLLNVAWNILLAVLTVAVGTLCTVTFLAKNKPSVSALLTSVAVVTPRVVSRVVYDVMLGAPSDTAEVVLMVIYYLSDLLIGLVGWVVIAWLTQKGNVLFAPEQKSIESEDYVV